jgi:hypothetical protein
MDIVKKGVALLDPSAGVSAIYYALVAETSHPAYSYYDYTIQISDGNKTAYLTGDAKSMTTQIKKAQAVLAKALVDLEKVEKVNKLNVARVKFLKKKEPDKQSL